MRLKLYNLIPKYLKENLRDLEKSLEAKYPDLKLDVYEDDKYIKISRIVVPKEEREKGIGTLVTLELVKYADKKKKIITLTPSSSFGGSVNRLKRFYKRFGFVENKGRNKDFKISESMYRLPK